MILSQQQGDQSVGVPELPIGFPGSSIVGAAEPLTAWVIFSAVLWLAVTKGVPAVWVNFKNDNHREERRFDELLEWVKRWIATTEQSTATLVAMMHQNKEVLAQMQHTLTHIAAMLSDPKLLNHQQPKVTDNNHAGKSDPES